MFVLSSTIDHWYCVFFDYTAVAGSGKVGPVNYVNHTSWVAVVTPTDCPKSVRNRCRIEIFCGVVCVVFCRLTFLLVYGLLSWDWVGSLSFSIDMFNAISKSKFVLNIKKMFLTKLLVLLSSFCFIRMKYHWTEPRYCVSSVKAGKYWGRCAFSENDFYHFVKGSISNHIYRFLFRKTLWKSFRSYSELLSKFGAMSFQEYVSLGITHPVFYGDFCLQT